MNVITFVLGLTLVRGDSTTSLGTAPVSAGSAVLGSASSAELQDLGTNQQKLGSASSPELQDLGTPQDECIVPIMGHLMGDEAVYRFTQDGCLLGWTNAGNLPLDGPSLKFDTCKAESHGLGSCPWEDRADDHGLMAIKSPIHCSVYKVSFHARGGISPTDDVDSISWMGVKLVDARNPKSVVKHFTPKLEDNWNWQDIVWDDIPEGCYRVVIQDGASGPDAHIEVNDVRIFAFGMTGKKMLSDIDTEISAKGKQCRPCSCAKWDDSTSMYSQCRPITDSYPCTNYCVKCEADGVTPMPGSHSRHDDECEVYERVEAQWWATEGQRVIEFDVAWGVDSEKEFDKGRMTLGASYIYENFLAPTVVTDVMIVPSSSNDEVQCPNGYDRRSTFNPQDTDNASPNKNRAGASGVGALALCVKREPCVEGRSYVYLLESSNGDENEAQEKSLSGCDYIGSWDDIKAFSWTSGERGHFYAGLYQCKRKCTSKRCAAVKIRAMEKAGSPQIGQEAGGMSIDAIVKNCLSDVDFTKTVSLRNGEEVTNSKTYTLEKSLDHSFSSTMGESLSVSASVGFSLFGASASVGINYSMDATQTHGFDSTYAHGSTTLHSSTSTANIVEKVKVTVPPRKQAYVSSEITFLRYETEFNAEADCIDANGEVIETKKIKGSFSGRTFKTTGKTMIFTTDCVETKCSCSRRRLMDRLGGESDDDWLKNL